MHFVEARGRSVTLRAAPIEVSRIIRSHIIGDRASTVLTSATLAVEGAFDYAKARLGLEDAATLLLPSEFDFRTQAVLFLPPEMPDPAIAGVQQRGRLADRRDSRPHERPRVRAVHVVRGHA